METEGQLELASRDKRSLEQELVRTRDETSASDREREERDEEKGNRLNELEQRNVSQEQEIDRAFEALAKREQELTIFLSALSLLTRNMRSWKESV